MTNVQARLTQRSDRLAHWIDERTVITLDWG